MTKPDETVFFKRKPMPDKGWISFLYHGLYFVPYTKEAENALRGRDDVVLMCQEDWTRLENKVIELNRQRD